MQVKINIVNAFVDGEIGGNPAGVVLDADQYNDAQKQEIAAKAGLSETSFVSKSDSDTFKLDFFTPNMRIAHCGHATVATFSYLSEVGLVGEGASSKETVDGSRRVNLLNNMAFMEQLAPRYENVDIHRERILISLGIAEADLIAAPMLVNTGNSFIVVGVKNAATLAAIEPIQDMINEISEELDLIGYYLFTEETTEEGRDASTRMFAPRYGITEEAATGMAAGPLACFLHDKLDMKQTEFKFEQGTYMAPASPSVLNVNLELAQGKIRSLMAGGGAKRMKEIVINI